MNVLPASTIKRLHVDRHVIKRNRKTGATDPAITIQTSRGPLKAVRAEIAGPCTFVYSPGKPLKCGAELWIETHAQVNYS